MTNKPAKGSRRKKTITETLLPDLNAVTTEKLVAVSANDQTLADIAAIDHNNDVTSLAYFSRIAKNPNCGPKATATILTSDEFKRIHRTQRGRLALELINNENIPAVTLIEHLPDENLRMLILGRNLNENESLRAAQKTVENNGDYKGANIEALLHYGTGTAHITYIVGQPEQLWADCENWKHVKTQKLEKPTITKMVQQAQKYFRPDLAVAVIANQATTDVQVKKLLDHYKDAESSKEVLYETLTVGLIKRQPLNIQLWATLYVQAAQLDEWESKTSLTILATYLDSLPEIASDELQQILEAVNSGPNKSKTSQKQTNNLIKAILQHFNEQTVCGSSKSMITCQKIAAEHNITLQWQRTKTPTTKLNPPVHTAKNHNIQIR